MRVRHAVLGVLLAALLPPQPSLAASCSFDPDSGTVSVTFRRHVGVVRDGDALLVGRKPCGDATVTNTDLIRFIALKGQRAVRLNLSGGPFAPGLTDEGDGSSEIEFDTISEGSGASVIVKGTSEADHFVVAGGVNLNADEESSDVDVVGSVLAIYGRGGDDLLTATTRPRSLRGGPGDDALVASVSGGGLLCEGGRGHDSLDYSNVECSIEVSAMFQIFGCPIWESYDVASGVEEMSGTAYDDVIEGSSGNDVLKGRGGDDFLRGRKGRDLLDGGAGTDTCEGGGGGDTFIRCEA